MPTSPPPTLTHLRACLASAVSHGNAEAADRAAVALTYAKAERAVSTALSAQPPLNMAQRNFLASLLASGPVQR